MHNIFESYTFNAVIHFAEKDLKPVDANGNPKKMSPGMKQEAIKSVAESIAAIESEISRDWHTNEVYSLFKEEIGKKKYLTDEIKRLTATTTAEQEEIDESYDFEWKLPPGIKESDVYRDGFYQIVDGSKTGIYMRKGKSSFVSVSNFTLTPIFHKLHEETNSRIIEVNDGIQSPTIVDIPSNAFTTRECRKIIFEKGPYFFYGDQYDWDKIIMATLRKFPMAFELENLGWQPEGFFAFYNAAYVDGEIKYYDDAGIVEHKGKKYYSPAVSKAYDLYRKDNDRFENDRYLVYAPPPIDFNKWMELVAAAYPDHKYHIIGGALISLFRDVHFAIDQNCPHVYFYGPIESGKTKAAQTLSGLFLHNAPGFNPSAGTDNAFAQKLGRYRNTPAVLNEFDMDRIKGDRENSIKEAYDGEARERGKGADRKKTETQHVTQLLVLVGQYLMTGDDNAIPSRSLTAKFTPSEDRPKEQIEAYKKIKDYEKKPLAGILCELLKHRELVEKEYPKKFMEMEGLMLRALQETGAKYRERPLRNYMSIPAMVETLSPHFKFPFSTEDVWQWAGEEITKISEMISSTDILMDFWNTIEALVYKGFIRQGEHFKKEWANHVKLSKKQNGQWITETLSFGTEEKEIMYINMPVCHKEYHDYMKGKALNKTTLENYLKDKPYYIGYRHSTRFEKRITPVDGGQRTTSRTAGAFVLDVKKADLGRLFTDITYEPKENPENSSSDNQESIF